jgi:hypothetical protein
LRAQIPPHPKSLNNIASSEPLPREQSGNTGVYRSVAEPPHPAQAFLDRIQINLDAGLPNGEAVHLALAGRVRVPAR